MGRCQGGFCRPRVIEILSRELNIPYEDITKRGEDSNILIGKTKELLLSNSSRGVDND
jgi:glycerol-3-phosphate dehydrogenase